MKETYACSMADCSTLIHQVLKVFSRIGKGKHKTSSLQVMKIHRKQASEYARGKIFHVARLLLLVFREDAKDFVRSSQNPAGKATNGCRH